MSSQTDLQRLRILIVEDNSFLRQIISHAVDYDHEVQSAATLEEGWDLYLNQRSHIVFLDIQLPDGNGHSLARRIKEHNPDCFVIMETANKNEDNLIQAEDNQVNGFISKPFRKAEIQDYIRLYMSHFRKE